MCNDNACCPNARIFQEKICGNFTGADPATPLSVWIAPTGSYFAGTFEIFNSGSSPSAIIGTVTTPTPGGNLGALPGNSDAASLNSPTEFTITAGAGHSGTFCITLYKRIIP